MFYADKQDKLDLLSLRYAVGHAMPSLKWRHHGIGCLQAYLHEGDTEVRLHVWHPSFILPTFTIDNGAAHDHRFGFTSRVLHGSLYNERIELTPDAAGAWTFHYVEHARKAAARTGSYDGECVRNSMRFSAERRGEWVHAGESYEMKPRDFHFSKASALAVTIVTKTELTDDSARILCRHDLPLQHAFSEHDTYPQHAHLMHAAARILRGERGE